MEISLFVLVFTSLIGILGLLYSLHFRYRALSMGMERLRNALSRIVSGDEEAGEKELREGLGELEWRIRRAILITSSLFIAVVGACLVLGAWADLEYWAIGLAGVSVLLACAIAALVLLRDIPRALAKHL